VTLTLVRVIYLDREAASLGRTYAGRNRARGAWNIIQPYLAESVNQFMTPRLLLAAIRDELLTVEDADAMKATLEARRFTMAFRHFGHFGNWSDV
jgi:hypothetical protein